MEIYNLSEIAKKTGKSEVEIAKKLISLIYTKAQCTGRDQKVIMASHEVKE